MVVPRAVIRDLHTGIEATKLMALVMLVISVSPILAPLTGSATFPIYVVDHASTGAKAIISAGIYRRPAGATRGFPAEYEGEAFVSDYYAGFLRRLHRTGSSWQADG